MVMKMMMGIREPDCCFVVEKYDERSARNHIKRMVEVLETPPVLSLITQGPAIEESITPRSRSQSQASQNNAQDGSDVPDNNGAEEEQKQS